MRRAHPAGVKRHDNVRMVQGGQHLHFGVETLQHPARAILIHRQHLDSHLALHEQVLGHIDFAHRAAAQPIQDAMVTQDQPVCLAG